MEGHTYDGVLEPTKMGFSPLNLTWNSMKSISRLGIHFFLQAIADATGSIALNFEP